MLTKSPPPTMMYRAMKTFAPNMVQITIPVALIVLTAAWTSAFQVSLFPLITSIMQAPRHPTPAASVGRGDADDDRPEDQEDQDRRG